MYIDGLDCPCLSPLLKTACLCQTVFFFLFFFLFFFFFFIPKPLQAGAGQAVMWSLL